MTNKSNAYAKITLIGRARERKDYSAADIRKVFREQFLSKHTVPILEALIESTVDDHFLAHLQNSMMYSFETVRFKLKDKMIVDLERNHELKGESSPETFAIEAEELDEYGPCNFFVGTPVPEIPTALAMVNNVYAYALANGYNPVKVTGAAANIATYKQYLQAGLKGFCSVGHGNTTGILLADGTLSYTWLNTLSKTALKPEVVTLNSCQVYNDPMKVSVLTHGARTFIGGITNLAIGPSEQVTGGFWKKELYTPQSPMGSTLQVLNSQFPNAGTFGIGGDTAQFK